MTTFWRITLLLSGCAAVIIALVSVLLPDTPKTSQAQGYVTASARAKSSLPPPPKHNSQDILHNDLNEAVQDAIKEEIRQEIIERLKKN